MKFSAIYGHQSLKQSFVQHIKSGRIPHAQMFHGLEGSHALALAVAYARFASCLNKEEFDSCDTCSSCVKFKQLIHPDLHFSFPFYGADETCDDFIHEFRSAFLENPLLNVSDWFAEIKGENKKPNINIRECRQIIKKLSLRPYESEFKILIMWLPEYLGKEGNVLLKLLEEPPQNTLFLLVTENREQILTTIISRTQVTRIPAYSHEEVENYLKTKGLAEGEIARNAALIAEGNLHKAIKLCGELHNPQFEEFRKWLLDCYQGQINHILADMDKFVDKGKEGLKVFFNYGIQLIRASFILAHRPMEHRLSAKELELVGKLAQFIHVGNVGEIYDAFNKSIFEIERNGSVKLILINLSLKLKSSLKKPKPLTAAVKQ